MIDGADSASAMQYPSGTASPTVLAPLVAEICTTSAHDGLCAPKVLARNSISANIGVRTIDEALLAAYVYIEEGSTLCIRLIPPRWPAAATECFSTQLQW